MQCIGNATKKLHEQVVTIPVVKEVYQQVLPNVHHKTLGDGDGEINERRRLNSELKNELELVAIMRKAGMEEAAIGKEKAIRKKHEDDRSNSLRPEIEATNVEEIDMASIDSNDKVENLTSRQDSEKASFLSETDISSSTFASDK